MLLPRSSEAARPPPVWVISAAFRLRAQSSPDVAISQGELRRTRS
jgi:hypothetical protein